MQESIFQLVGKPRIKKFEFELNEEYSFDGEIKLDMNNNIQISKGIDENAQQAIVTLSLGIFESLNIDQVPFKIMVDIEGHFNWNEKMEADGPMLDSMLKQNAPAILYSYTRPIITMITVEANMPPLVIPLMNFQQE
jgi:preprotein translocase subunit SecB